ncbi:MAG: hypothetical protein KGZ81_05620 [Flavobacteriales bacterium]|nr:hypothetical protein [Flavobacteriales bacterium]MBS4040061.1 hypothetical protein [Flavobacteriales bacterium]
MILIKKTFLLFLTALVLFFCSCLNRENIKTVEKFEKKFGILNSKNLNDVVDEFESYLNDSYPTSLIDSSYKSFIKNYINDKELNTPKFSEHVNEILLDNSFRSNFYNYYDGYYSSYSNFYLSIFDNKDIDSITLKYLEFLESGGVLFDFDVAENVFLNQFDYTNYFHKRFIIVHFFIKPPNYCQYPSSPKSPDFGAK